ncbi:hypothetical protein PG994_000753 [Apiospora phragmitis]|uniref:DUF6594 domain-containing protein n=1 Tax=Apiospora phragmitis TaxID=2905665 RepID=A0ABR1X790_9PEZI
MQPESAKGAGIEPAEKVSTNCDHHLDGLSVLPYFERLTHFVRGSTRHWVAGGVTVVDFRPLYTITIHHMQSQLARWISQAEKEEVTGEQLEQLKGMLHSYTDALRNFEFIHANRWNTQFAKNIAASRLDNGPGSQLQAALISEQELEAHEKHHSIFQDSDLLGSFDHNLMQHSTAVGRSLGRSRLEEIQGEQRRARTRTALRRFFFAVIGGLIIIGPMFVLTWGIATPKQLAVVSVSIILFATGVAIFSTTEPENLLAVTAAYAAVMMGLVGTGNDGLVT